MKRKVVSFRALPIRLPVVPTIVAWLALDHWAAPQWLYAVIFTLLGLLWILLVVGLFFQESVDIFEQRGTP